MIKVKVKVVYGEQIRVGTLVSIAPKEHTVKLDDGELFKTGNHWPEWWPDRAIYDFLKCNKKQKQTLTGIILNYRKWDKLDCYKGVTIINGSLFGESLVSHMIKDIT